MRGIIELACDHGLEAAAEYVETEAIAAVRRKLGVDYARGYAIAKPEPLEQILKSLAQDESRRLRRRYLEL